MNVYKYLPIERANILRDRLIRFSQPAVLNDPFEFLPCFPAWMAQFQTNDERLKDVNPLLLEHACHRTLAELIQHFGGKFAYLSLSKINDDQRMWSLYASSHAGMVLGLDAQHPFFSNVMSGIKDVVYSDSRLALDQLADLATAFLVKSRDWEFEQECRAIALSNRADKLAVDGEGRPLYLFELPPNCIKEVILGYRMTLDHRRDIRQVVKELYPAAKIREVVLDTTQHVLKIIESDENSDDAIEAIDLVTKETSAPLVDAAFNQAIEGLPEEQQELVRRKID